MQGVHDGMTTKCLDSVENAFSTWYCCHHNFSLVAEESCKENRFIDGAFFTTNDAQLLFCIRDVISCVGMSNIINGRPRNLFMSNYEPDMMVCEICELQCFCDEFRCTTSHIR